MKNGSEEKKTKRKEVKREYGQKKKKRPLIEMNRSLSPIDGEDGSGYFAYFTRPIMRLSVTTGNEKCAPARLCVCVCGRPHTSKNVSLRVFYCAMNTITSGHEPTRGLCEECSYINILNHFNYKKRKKKKNLY